jgi:hypothetical protein
VDSTWIWKRVNHFHHEKGGGRSMSNKFHLTTPVFNDRRTLVREMIK